MITKRAQGGTDAASIGGAVIAAAALAALLVLAAGRDGTGDRIALTGNRLAFGPDGAPLWIGAFTNRAGRLYRDVAVAVRFLDREGRILGRASAHADRLAPGESFDLTAPLPMGAQAVQLVAMHWRHRAARASLGPWPLQVLGAFA
ncbi:FxLYD domain-containing protein [Sphingomonas colocasiae]|uniref:FxLYD domain-containing protein n=1 Tax=Sphingomonas colocasiae TaxID=1848973 RepID=A0ABS7PW70_9SPHN|nr:FxLYD domain-containing protein [Sphingomonas colocasiae]MBY8825199.1 FxLYD domain-containing protein [Sphingomonas colocasiae]